MALIVGCLIGLFFGTALGVLVVGLCQAGGRADDAMHRFQMGEDKREWRENE